MGFERQIVLVRMSQVARIHFQPAMIFFQRLIANYYAQAHQAIVVGDLCPASIHPSNPASRQESAYNKGDKQAGISSGQDDRYSTPT